MKIMNLTTNELVADKVVVANRLITRMVGLLGHKSLSPGSGLLITPCMGIHTIGMRFSIDAVFLDRDDTVIATLHSFPPNRISRIYRRGAAVIELPAGSLKECAVSVGDKIEYIN